jgi:hypothetical protein
LSRSFKKSSKRRIIGITSIISVLVGSIALPSNFAQIGQWPGIHPPKLSTTRPATEIIESLLKRSRDWSIGWSDALKYLEENPKALLPPTEFGEIPINSVGYLSIAAPPHNLSDWN